MFDQSELNDLVLNTCLSKESAELLASDLREGNLWRKWTQITFYRTRHQEPRKYLFSDGLFVACNDAENLLKLLSVEKHEASDWKLFIDS